MSTLTLMSAVAVVPAAWADEVTPGPTATQTSPAPTSAPTPAPTTVNPGPPSQSPSASPSRTPSPTTSTTPSGNAAVAARARARAAAAAGGRTAAEAREALAAKQAADLAKAGAVAIAQAHTPAEGAFPSSLWGVDVADWQHPEGALLGWPALAAPKTGAAFAFVKVSEGLSFTNPSGVIDRAALAKQDTLVGAYHYAVPAYPVDRSAVAQARFAFAQTGKLTAGQLPLVLDLESNPNNLTPPELAAWSLSWLKEAERLTGRRPIFYTYPAFFNSSVDPVLELASYPLWIANYGLELRSPSVPAPWTGWTFWQYSSQGRGLPGQVPGTQVDLNVFAGTLPELNLLAGIVKLPEGLDQAARTTASLQAGADGMGDALLRALTTPPATR